MKLRLFELGNQDIDDNTPFWTGIEKGSNDSLYARYNENWVYDSNLLPTKIGEPNGGEVEKCMQFVLFGFLAANEVES